MLTFPNRRDFLAQVATVCAGGASLAAESFGQVPQESARSLREIDFSVQFIDIPKGMTFENAVRPCNWRHLEVRTTAESANERELLSGVRELVSSQWEKQTKEWLGASGERERCHVPFQVSLTVVEHGSHGFTTHRDHSIDSWWLGDVRSIQGAVAHHEISHALWFNRGWLLPNQPQLHPLLLEGVAMHAGGRLDPSTPCSWKRLSTIMENPLSLERALGIQNLDQIQSHRKQFYSTGFWLAKALMEKQPQPELRRQQFGRFADRLLIGEEFLFAARETYGEYFTKGEISLESLNNELVSTRKRYLPWMKRQQELIRGKSSTSL
ncbi:MAG: hypothetical protein KDD60_06965 [Bdellovibrionales bacterium]|nr:hypothetical protein [Bdellovibrionales bacterium]